MGGVELVIINIAQGYCEVSFYYRFIHTNEASPQTNK